MKYLYTNNQTLYQIHLKFWVNKEHEEDKKSFLFWAKEK